MLVQGLILVADASTPGSVSLGLNIGTLMSGLAALLVAIGTGLGAFVRYRKAAKRIKFQAELDQINIQANLKSIKTATEAADRLSLQYEARLVQSAEAIDRLMHSNDEQRHVYEERLSNQQELINTLLAQILKQPK